MKALVISLCGIIISSLAFARGEEPLIYLNPSDTLYVEVMENVAYDHIGRNDRFRNFKETLEEVFDDVDFPMNYEIIRSGSRHSPEGQPRLSLTIMRWGDNGMSQIEARFIASLKKDYDRNKLGIFYYRGMSGIGTTEQVSRIYNDVLKKALFKMVTELNERLIIMEEFLEEDIKVGDDLNDGLSTGE